MPEAVRIIPLGGLGEVGKNMTAFEHGGRMILVDAGLSPFEALAAYRQGLEHHPTSLPLAYHAACVSGELHTADAAQDWKRALSLGSQSTEVLTEYARWLWARGREREAVAQAREALRRDPSYLPAIRLLGERGARDHLVLAEALAREQAFRLTRSAEDYAELARIARTNRPYARRLAGLKLPTPSITKP